MFRLKTILLTAIFAVTLIASLPVGAQAQRRWRHRHVVVYGYQSRPYVAYRSRPYYSTYTYRSYYYPDNYYWTNYPYSYNTYSSYPYGYYNTYSYYPNGYYNSYSYTPYRFGSYYPRRRSHFRIWIR